MKRNKHKSKDHLSSSLYEATMSHFLYQDRLVWDMAQLIVVVQGGVLASSYTLRTYWISPFILIIGAILSVVILVLVIKCEVDRDVNIRILDKLSVYLLPSTIKAELVDDGICEPFVHASGSLPSLFKFIRGRYIIRFVFICFIIIDLTLGLLMICFEELFLFSQIH